MIPRTYFPIVFWIAATLWALLLVLQGASLPEGFFRPASTVLGTVVLIIGAFDRWIWRWPFLHPWFVGIPNLEGTWKGEILSDWADPQTGQQILPIEAFLAVRQTFSSIRLYLITRSSSSELLAGSIVQNPDGTHTIFGTYRNTPRISERSVSSIHHGAVRLNVRGKQRPILDGDYWTDRLTRGELRFESRTRALHYDFDQAAAANYRRATK